MRALSRANFFALVPICHVPGAQPPSILFSAALLRQAAPRIQRKSVVVSRVLVPILQVLAFISERSSVFARRLSLPKGIKHWHRTQTCSVFVKCFGMFSVNDSPDRGVSAQYQRGDYVKVEFSGEGGLPDQWVWVPCMIATTLKLLLGRLDSTLHRNRSSKARCRAGG